MRWEQGHQSNDVEDRRGQRFGGSGLRIGLGGALVLLLLSLIFKRNMFALLGIGGGPPPQGHSLQTPAEQDQLAHFVAFVFDDVQGYWAKAFTAQGKPYRKSVLVLFSDATQAGCGVADSAIGPFYCPTDEKVYIDLGFYQELKTRFGAPGDFAQAYVIAHEVGHHVQDVLGVHERVRAEQQRDPSEENPLSVRTELQADCLAGMWAHAAAARDLLEPGDIEEALNAAAAVGDDRIQRSATGRIQPEKWTHGSARQRSTWFRRGFGAAGIADCDTFQGT